MRELTLREIQMAELDILKDIDVFCEKHKIRYYLACGTLLGAVRHKGFIPWDDDIDIIMPRVDYNKFIKLFKKALENNEVKLYYNIQVGVRTIIQDTRIMAKGKTFRKTDKESLYIDVFPMDGVPSNNLKLKIHYMYLRALLDIIYFIDAEANIKRKNRLKTILQYAALPLKPILKMIGTEKLCLKLNKTAMKYHFDECNKCAVIQCGYGLKEVNIRQDYEVQCKVSFEDNLFTTTKAYDKYLKNIYGDYMVLPPIDQRDRHEMRAWLRE